MMETPDPTGRNELLCPLCDTYVLLPKYASESETVELAGCNPDNPQGCPYCGTQMLVRRQEAAA